MSVAFERHYPPLPNRVHEVFGDAAMGFGAMLCGQMSAPTIWIAPSHLGVSLAPSTLARFVDPRRITMVHSTNTMQSLWSMEEALRSSAVGLVICELAEPIGFTAGRRLQLAAETGGAMGLLIGGSETRNPAAETRWHCAAQFDPHAYNADSTLQSWEIIKNKKGTKWWWEVEWNDETRRVAVVSEAAR